MNSTWNTSLRYTNSANRCCNWDSLCGSRNMSKPVTAVIIGAGNRGFGYSNYAIECPEKFKVVGVAEPRQFFLDRIRRNHNVVDEKVFKSWTEAATVDKFADVAIIATQDQMHKEPVLAFAKKGYHILLEKPMAVSYADCCEIVSACEAAGVMLAVCHVLRYTPQARKIKQLIQSGVIGDVVNIQHTEPVGFWHFAHSFVRGNWRNTESSTFSLLAKSCHDLDLIQMWMGEEKCVSLASFGSLKHFTAANKPTGAGSRCVECAVENDCPYSAKKIYMKSAAAGNRGWPVNVITEVPDIESVTEAVKNGPYGRCVYDCDNDVVDNQTVIMQFNGGATVSFTMVAFTESICARKTKVYGTKGELTCDFAQQQVNQFDFLTNKTIVHELTDDFEGLPDSLRGHGGADFFAIQAFIQAVVTGDSRHILTGPKDSLYSHYLCFVAEKARLENRVVDLRRDNIL